MFSAVCITRAVNSSVVLTRSAQIQRILKKIQIQAWKYRCPRTGSPEKKGSLTANILTCILKKKSPISNDNREKTF
jgi:hypothetical protein